MADKNTFEKEKDHILKLIDEIGLSIFSDEDWNRYIETLNKEANEVYDYDKVDVEKIKRIIGL